MTIDKTLLNQVDALIETLNTTRSAFIREVTSRHNQTFKRVYFSETSTYAIIPAMRYQNDTNR